VIDRQPSVGNWHCIKPAAFIRRAKMFVLLKKPLLTCRPPTSLSITCDQRRSHKQPQGGRCMVGYRCYVLDAADHIVQAHNIDCDDDTQAQAEAANFLTQDPYHSSVEIWRAARRIGTLERPAGLRLRLSKPAPRSLRPVAALP
jgi:hypothetical protein